MFELFKTRLEAAICTRLDCPGYPHTYMCTFSYGQSDYPACRAKWFLPGFLMSIAKDLNIYCNQRGQPSHAAVEGEGRVVLHHEPNQEQLDDSTEGLRRFGRRRWFIIYEQA